jgi:hypothetical protein
VLGACGGSGGLPKSVSVWKCSQLSDDEQVVAAFVLGLSDHAVNVTCLNVMHQLLAALGDLSLTRKVRKARDVGAHYGVGFEAFLLDACTNILSVTKGAVYVCMSSSELHTLQRAFTAAGGKWSTFVIWAKNTVTLGRADYQRQYEPILYGWKDGSDHYWCGARDQGDVWFVNKPVKNDLHPTMKPVALVERAIRNSSKSRDIVLDPFGGSRSTLIAARPAAKRG